jgi:hypothetical protein
MAHQFSQLDEQLNEVNAAYPILKDHPAFKPGKDFVAPVPPGSESVFTARRGLEELRNVEAVAFQLCSALNEEVSLQIHDTRFVPREFVAERLAQTLREFLCKKVAVGEGGIERPVVLERRINNFCSVFQLVENYLDLDVSAIVRETLLSQVYHVSVAEAGTYAANLSNPSEWEESMLKPLVVWYTSFVTTHLMGERGAVVYSPNRKAFVSRTGNGIENKNKRNKKTKETKQYPTINRQPIPS